MTEIAASDFRHPRRHVRLDTILRLRWLAALGQLAAIFVVAQGLEFELPIIPCLVIVGLSALLNLALQMAFNPMQRLEPLYAGALLALNIVELAGLLYFTGGLQNPFSFMFLAPVLISATALPVRLTVALGALALACASILVFVFQPLPWDGDEPLVLPPIYLLGVWLSIVLAIGVTSLYSFQVTEEARQLSDALAATELVLAREQHLTQLDGLAAAAAHELGTPLSTIVLVSRELERALQGNALVAGDIKTLREQAQRCRDILSKITQLSATGAPFDHMKLSTLIEETVAPHRDFGIAIKVRIDLRHQGTGRLAQSRDPLWRRQHPGERRRFRPLHRGGERVVEQRDRRDRHFRRRAGVCARHPEADRRALSVAPPRHGRCDKRARGPRARRVHRPHAVGAHRRQDLVYQPDIPRSRRGGSNCLAPQPVRGSGRNRRTARRNRRKSNILARLSAAAWGMLFAVLAA